MNARSAVFALISIRSQPLRKLVNRLPYAPPTVYNAVHRLESENLVKIENGAVMVVEGYRARKLSGIYVQSLAHGIDPEILTRESTISVWKSLEGASTVKGVVEATGLSVVSVKKILAYLKDGNLVIYRKRRPIVVERNAEHTLSTLLKEYLAPEKEGRAVPYPGEAPFRDVMETPEQVEKILYQQIDESLAVKNTGFLVKGDSGKVTVVESVDRELTNEEVFLRKLFTTEGAEEYCILMVKQRLLDYEKLSALAIQQDAVNVVGCYLDILGHVDEKMIPPSVIEMFLACEPKRRKTFLPQEKGHGKQGWETPFEERWNVDLYIDLGAIRHGVGSL
ncbi:MAG: hypothetical protein AB1665_04080 [Candidatus Thermoplasmatota archaeon]